MHILWRRAVSKLEKRSHTLLLIACCVYKFESAPSALKLVNATCGYYCKRSQSCKRNMQLLLHSIFLRSKKRVDVQASLQHPSESFEAASQTARTTPAELQSL